MSDAFAYGSDPGPRPLLDRLDARMRVAATFTVVLTIVVLRSPFLLAALVPVAVMLAVLAGLSVRELARRLTHLEGFLVILALLLPVTVPGPNFVVLGPVALSQPGVERAVLVLLRVNLCAIAIFTLLAGLEPVRFGHALARLGMPAKLVHLLLFAARYVVLIRAEAGRLHDAMRARAFRGKTSRHTLRTLGHFTGQLMVRAFERAERIDEAMRCRGFVGRFVLVADGRIGGTDIFFAALTGLGLALLITMDRLT
ncbi:cobalt ECF transporter T component CbiQ [Xanthobacteraceae bacterium Astr-EGSB]|uniref:cobalt ECF transporter T component CbiQ n=1 Tax=Astrobacterium formosum TaxID=3069710 RepID=UPI0027B1D57A|nr:cobalt ECF transporter T component CbiQ [Xanthobacteraceae bacterium Astr-EGSB]